MNGMRAEWTKFRADVAVRTVDVNRPGTPGIDWGSPIIKQYKIRSLPSFLIYGPRGTELARDRDAYDQVMKALHDDMDD